ncbi:hypothetical protein AB0M54_06730 [Actinoplanes sp. NPDC051470]|uniref:hypothetical protein n=1 Tax=Actinoplanes sp. NPDC051470 TaxID=3157224 RepID=UPI0034356FCC
MSFSVLVARPVATASTRAAPASRDPIGSTRSTPRRRSSSIEMDRVVNSPRRTRSVPPA